MMAVSARLPQVFMVEPQFVLRRTVVALARKLEVADVAEATSSSGALALLKRRSFDALVLDLDDVEGAFSILRELRQGELASGRDIAACLTTAQPLEPSLQARAEGFGIVACLQKPYRIARLFEAIGLRGL